MELSRIPIVSHKGGIDLLVKTAFFDPPLRRDLRFNTFPAKSAAMPAWQHLFARGVHYPECDALEFLIAHRSVNLHDARACLQKTDARVCMISEDAI